MKMGLMHDQFELVREGSKTIEIRLNDQKRQQLRVGDPIVFEDLTTQQRLSKQVAKLEKFVSFVQLYDHYQGIVVGSAPTDSVAKMVSDTYRIYSKQQEAEHGVLAIHLE
ncbi:MULTISPECIES: ASCH domain-containing protein [Lacticaseibacillus]|uniref:ASCH domain-containing protein n=1 Tax=Lacticaseibacillus casei DSM 20011 = JCM 1134 = ATCC 393 TaxID=1423732 RepID=A0AAD1ARR4_LACCA|nr:ASCH domain-containing protein [Lacticaseibacillus casei]HAJ53300.1 ASCH domain-containing protein [Lactobacillus sp.]MBI6597338.1 ASCH domain-containing protein [Lacticaseibacillus casei]MBO1481075.1 ASCH domain-containing protein [Lacticaseibacillus casei]MBO2416314.1 ASCH domain-containing protein [Lacticaseibacillus casei]MCK2080756.1 ASCH domain-containing protein [Lacticaseibacillus casei]